MTLSKRWTKLRYHEAQHRYFHSTARFNVTPAARRSGKSEIAKRRLVLKAVRGTKYDEPRFAYGAPTHLQAKKIAWKDLKRMVPMAAMRTRPSETELTIPLWHGGELFVTGMDKPERLEGAPLDHIVLDEYGNMKEEAWTANVRPALADRNGSADLIGVPEGRNHYYDIAEFAKAAEIAGDPDWRYHHWKSADILPPSEIEAARRDMDPLTFQQEMEGSFVTFEGRAYYTFSDHNKAALRAKYNPKQPLIICLDFNVAPGVAAIAQELPLPIRAVSQGVPIIASTRHIGTAIIGEVHIPNNSNTPAVCRKILKDWEKHEGLVVVYGDATGGQGGSAKVQGSDWELAKQVLRSGDPSQDLKGFGDRVSFKVKLSNPAERARVNAVNSRICATDGTVRLMVDPTHAPHVVKDFEGVRLLKGGSGEIDKDIDKKLTHLSDAVGYYEEYEFPLKPRQAWGSAGHNLP